MKPPEYKTQHHPTTSSTLCRTPQLNNKQNKNANPITSRQEYHLTQPCPSEEKQELSTNLTLFKVKALSPIQLFVIFQARILEWVAIRAETKRKKEFNLEAWEKETSNTIT